MKSVRESEKVTTVCVVLFTIIFGLLIAESILNNFSEMKKGKKVEIFIQTSKFDGEKKEGIIKDIIKSKIGKDLFVVEVEGNVHFRFENELK